jgi:phosphoglycerate dehydrogenase-like enzyme
MPGTNSRAVAEHALGLMLAVLRQIRRFDADVRRGDGWSWPEARQDRLGEIGGRTVGLVGMGGIPQLLAPTLTALGATVIYTARAAKPSLPFAFVDLDTLLERSDIVSLHVPLTDATRHLLNALRFARMRRGSVLINTARGALVDETALIAALDAGHVAAAGLDVFDAEPVASDNPLLRRDDVVLTPHIAWLTRETLARSIEVAVANCHRLANAQPLLHRVV